MKLRRTAFMLCEHIEKIESYYWQGYKNINETYDTLNEIETTTKTLFYAKIINVNEFMFLMESISSKKDMIFYKGSK